MKKYKLQVIQYHGPSGDCLEIHPPLSPKDPAGKRCGV